MNEIIEMCDETVEIEFGEGFWSDHWTYNLDLIEEYLNIYPDKVKELLIKDENYKFYNSPEYVLPRKDKYSIEDGKVRMHMEFKYILELIKNGLYEEFFEDIKTAMPPFMNPEVYGRSILENSLAEIQATIL